MKIFSIIIPVTLVSALILSTSGSCATIPDIHPKTAIPTTPVQLEPNVNTLIFTGVVKRIPNGTALVTNSATYLLDGGNFEGIVGKEVNIIGRVVKEGSIEKIIVARAQLAGD